MNEIEIFKNADFGEVRTMTIDNKPYFVGKDVAQALGYSQADKAIVRHVEEDDRMKRTVTDNLGRYQETFIINESGLYSLILSSKLPTAKKFKHWVTSEILPTIRRHGAYMTDSALEQALTSPDFLIKLATQLKAEKERNAQLETKIEIDKPKVIFADAVSVSKNSILVGELAKLLKQNGIEIGQNRLFTWLRENGYLISRKGSDYNMPTQKSMEMKLFEIKETTLTHSDGHTSVTKTPKVSGKGQIYFINLFMKRLA